ncbi:putative leucine-rich repeat domain superfamily [Helianthus anomalus]
MTCNFSYNNLTGTISSVLLLQNMALTSFTGNNGLCGSPLPPCDGSSDSNPTPPSSNSRRIFTTAAVAAGDDDGGGRGVEELSDQDSGARVRFKDGSVSVLVVFQVVE